MASRIVRIGVKISKVEISFSQFSPGWESNLPNSRALKKYNTTDFRKTYILYSNVIKVNKYICNTHILIPNSIF